MAHPKRKISKSRKNKRRTHDKIADVVLAKCDNCGAAHRRHHVCEECGTYRGRQIIEVSA